MEVLETETNNSVDERRPSAEWALFGNRARWQKGIQCGGHWLLPAVIQSKRTGEVLMLGYMSLESFEASLKARQVVFYSRSKQRLWHKGETSGNFFDIEGVALDCDEDTFLFSVREHGPACHRNVTSCFTNDNGSDCREVLAHATVVSRVYDTILHRAKGDDSASYSFKMLQGNIDRILKKIAEEAAETILAAKNLQTVVNRSVSNQPVSGHAELGNQQSCDAHSIGGACEASLQTVDERAGQVQASSEFVGEAADLLFHLLLCCAKLGTAPELIMEELLRRQGAPRRDGSLPK